MIVVAFVFFVVPSAQGPLTDASLESASGGRVVRLGRIGGGVPVTNVPLEVYVARILAGEGEPRAADAAQQALAVAIRTYVLANPDRHPREDFDLCDSTHCQVPRAATEVTRRAALATAGQLLTYMGQPAELFYSASCGGRSENASEIGLSADFPYLQSVRDDVHEDDVPWTVTLTLREVQEALRGAGFSGQRLRDVRVDARNESGRVSRLRLTGMQPEVIAGYQFRMAVGPVELRSTAFSVERRGETLRFTGRGFGHGVGMCVIGAGRRATRGEDAAGILGHYYPGLELVRTTVVPPPIAPQPVGARAVSIRVPRTSGVAEADVERMAARAYDELSKTLGVSLVPITIELHATLESFRAATGKPWWVSAVSQGTAIDLVPAALLAQREGLEPALRTAMAELLMAQALAGRPAWVRVGGGRHFGRAVSPQASPQTSPQSPPAAPAASARLRCPVDAELTLAISAPAQRDAEARAEACFARELARTRDWRTVR